MTRHHSCRVSPFGHPRIHARLTAPRGISQPPTSFIGSQCQGIHHAPLNTYNTKPKNESPTHNTHPPPKGRKQTPCAGIRKICITPNTQHHKHCAFRCSQPLSTNQTPHPTTKAGQQQEPPPPTQNLGSKGRHTILQRRSGRGLVVSKPNSVSDKFRTENPALRLNPVPAPNVCCCTRP